MDKKPEIQNYICVIDVDNRQNDYARCSQTIERIENRMQIHCVYDCVEWWPFYMLRGYETGTINNLRRIRELEQHLAKRNGYESNIKKADDINRVIIKNENSDICFQYYFRISLSQSELDIIELQYFILLLQSLPKLDGRIAVSFISKRGQWTIGDYFRVSHYLFFVQKKYPIFYAAFHDGEPVQRLTRNHKGVQKTFIPVLEIDWTNLEKMSRPWKLTNNYTNQSFSELYSAVEVENCSDLNFTEYLFQVGLRMLFSSLNGKKYNTINAKRKLIDSLCDLVEENHGITAIDMILIGAFGGEFYREVANEKSSAFLGTIQEISGAIRQVLENIVNHSANAKGVFSLRLQENQTYLKQKYPQFMSEKNNGCVELLIADSNTRDTITTNFLSSTKADISLRNHADSICLSNFFGVFQNDDIKKLWQSARQKRPTTCFGLLTFAGAINQIKGSIKVRSSTLTSEKDDRNFFSNTESVFETEKQDSVFLYPRNAIFRCNRSSLGTVI